MLIYYSTTIILLLIVVIVFFFVTFLIELWSIEISVNKQTPKQTNIL